MSFLKKLGKGLGSILKTAAPVLAFTPLGPLGAAGAGALGSVLSGGNAAGHLSSAAQGGLSGAMLKRLGGGAAGGTPPIVPGSDTYSRLASAANAVAPDTGFGGHLKRLGGGAIDWIKEHPDIALAGASGVAGALSARTADKRLKRLEEDERRRFEEGRSMLAQDRPVDTSSYIYR